MERLTSFDLETLLGFLRDTYVLRDLHGFTVHVVTALRELIPSDNCAYNDMDLRQRTAAGLVDPPGWTAEAQQAFERHVHEHPVIDYYRRTGDPGAYKVSDFLTQRQVHRLALYNEFARPYFGTEYQLGCPFLTSPARVVGVTLGRRLRDFSERDRLLLNLLRPHLFQAYENARAADRMARDLDRLRRGVEASDRGMLFISRDGRVRLATPRAREWLAAYFDTARAQPAHRLPDALWRWVEAQEAGVAGNGDAPPPRAPLVMERDGRRLVVRLVADAEERVLLLEEQRSTQPAMLEHFGLSRREAEVLAWVTRGKTNAQIATLLGSKTRTVEKHLERIYRKLRVETRTAATALVHAAR